MKIFPTQKSRITLVCIGLLISALAIVYFIQHDRYKIAFFNFRNLICGKQNVLGLYKPIEFRVEFFGMIYEGRSGNIVDDEILYYGAQEKPILFFLRDCAKSFNRDDIVFFDIGANVGQHSLFMSKFVKDVHAFEPYPPVLKRFRKNIRINQIKNIHIHDVGLGNEGGNLPFFEPPESDLGHGSFIMKEFNTTNVKSLSVVVGDEWLKKIAVSHVDIIKCDIEGFEKNALLGLRNTLEKNRPIIVMELISGLDTSFKNIDDLYAVVPSNYKILSFCEWNDYSGHYELCETIPNFHEKRINIVVYPTEKKNLIKLKSYE